MLIVILPKLAVGAFGIRTSSLWQPATMFLLISSHALIRLTDWREKQEGKDIPHVPAAIKWEAMPMVDLDNVVRDADDSMLPGIILTDALGREMGCTFNAKNALTIASFLTEYVGLIMGDTDEAELRALNEGQTQAIFEGAYGQMKALVEKDNTIKTDLLKDAAIAQGYRDGMQRVLPVIEQLVSLLEMEPGQERDTLAESARTAIGQALET